MGKSKIAWTERSWNFIRARRRSDQKQGWYCQKVSPACTNCYAERQNARFGTHVPYSVDKLSEVEIYLDEDALREPLKWKKPSAIFPVSMSDLFASWVPDEWLHKAYAVMALTPHHTYNVLTKRAERRLAFLNNLAKNIAPIERAARELGYTFKFDGFDGREHSILPWPIPNLREGSTVCNQDELHAVMPVLEETPAAVRWLSIEPQISSICLHIDAEKDEHQRVCCKNCGTVDVPVFGLPNWIVVGGESGSCARPFEIEWARTLLQQCKAARVPFFFKQGSNSNWADFKTFEAFPVDLQVRQYPERSRAH
jgi:protein gp37